MKVKVGKHRLLVGGSGTAGGSAAPVDALTDSSSAAVVNFAHLRLHTPEKLLEAGPVCVLMDKLKRVLSGQEDGNSADGPGILEVMSR